MTNSMSPSKRITPGQIAKLADQLRHVVETSNAPLGAKELQFLLETGVLSQKLRGAWSEITQHIHPASFSWERYIQCDLGSLWKNIQEKPRVSCEIRTEKVPQGFWFQKPNRIHNPEHLFWNLCLVDPELMWMSTTVIDQHLKTTKVRVSTPHEILSCVLYHLEQGIVHPCFVYWRDGDDTYAITFASDSSGWYYVRLVDKLEKSDFQRLDVLCTHQ